MVSKILFSFILVLALFLRVYRLDSVPPSLNWDEVSLGYNAYSILKTGKDEWGEFLPLSFRAYGDYKLPGYVYLSVPFIALFGLNEWGVRLPSATFGVLGVIGIFLITKRLTRRTDLGLWAFFIAAVTPWLIILSRIALEANVALTLTIFGVYFFLLGLEKRWTLILSGLFFGLTIFTYNSSRVVTPLLVFILSVFYFKDLIPKKKIVFSIVALVIFISFFAVAFPKAIQQDSSARYKWTTILDQGAINRINELRGSSALSPTLSQIQYNKVTYFIPEFFKNYFSHFDPKFLFAEGGSNYQFSVPGSGLLLWVVAPLLILGLLKVFRERKNWQLVLVLWWLLAIVPAAITRDAPHALRSLLMIPPVIVLSVLGIDNLFNMKSFKSQKTFLSVVLVITTLLNLSLFWNNYSETYVKNYSWSWQYGYKQAIEFIENYPDKNKMVFFTKKYGEPHEFILFYTKYDPLNYQHSFEMCGKCGERYEKSDWFWVDRFDKYYFINDWEIQDKLKDMHGLLITSPGNSPGGKVVKTIEFLDGKKAFDIVELQ